MRARGPLLLAILVAWSLAAVAAPAPKSTSAKPQTWTPKAKADTAATSFDRPMFGAKAGRRFINGVQDTGQFLHDSTLILRVGPRTIRARELVDTYFDSYAEFRPPSDSNGRLEFLNNMINREVMALVAKEVNRPLTFEDRAVLREYSQRVLSNVLMQRMVLDSVKVTEQEKLRVYDQMAYENRFRAIVVKDAATAGKLRADLVSGKVGWANAYPKYNIQKGAGELGDLGFVPRDKLDPLVRIALYDLKPGEYSQPFQDPTGWHVVQVTERRKIPRVKYEAIATLIESQVFELKASARSTKLEGELRTKYGVTYEMANLEWVSSQFAPTREMGQEGDLSAIQFSGRIPHFENADTSRVLARWGNGGVLTLGQFLHHYRGIQPLLRHPVNTPMSLRQEIDSIVLEPYRAQLARELGLDKDRMAVAIMDRRTEAIMVNHLYEDSVGSKVWVTPEMRHKFYQDHLAQFVTYPEVRFASFYAQTKAEADSIVSAIKGGQKAASILLADSLGGRKRGTIQSQKLNEESLPYHQQLFEELRPGDVVAYGPDDEGHFVVLNSLEFVQGRQLSYAESEKWVDESVQNLEADRRLQEFIARHKPKYKIESHPELLMSLLWIDPASR
jgi:hypothetical protein